MSRLVVAISALGALSSVPLAVVNGFHVLCVIVMLSAALRMAAADAQLLAPKSSSLGAGVHPHRASEDRPA
ncbi:MULTISPECIES: hypothetical protein [Clavibacter]|uniref:Uncharacterized protein n=1 Tax=Clavibacter seminis TaxID=2860285 RepID=A0ABY3TBN9_9MICO|nr:MULTISPECIES: hypothetical protein [Clavibacter]UKF24632.1 hypothetical protein KYT88_13035 [Clavibacter sp. A6099]